MSTLEPGFKAVATKLTNQLQVTGFQICAIGISCKTHFCRAGHKYCSFMMVS